MRWQLYILCFLPTVSPALAPLRFEERAALVCAATDQTSCDSQAEYLKSCGVKLVEGKSVASEELKKLLSGLSSDVPVYIVADGKPSDLERVSRIVGRRPSWIQICAGKEACAYSLSGISVPRCQGPFKKKDRKVAMEMMTHLICDKKRFDDVDNEKSDGVLSAREVNLFLTGALGGLQRQMAAGLLPEKTQSTLEELKKDEKAFGMSAHSKWQSVESGGKVSLWREDLTQLCLNDAEPALSGNSFHPFRSPWIDWSKEQARFIEREVGH